MCGEYFSITIKRIYSIVHCLLGLMPAMDLRLLLLCTTNQKNFISSWVTLAHVPSVAHGGSVIRDCAQDSIKFFC
jgi:hypothetical protein